MCMREWQRQQPLRSASVQRVVKMAASDVNSSFWVDWPACAMGPSLFLSRSRGIIQLLDADAPTAQPVLLALRTNRNFHAFMGRDGMLRIVEGQRDPESDSQVLTWHTINPASGTTTASVSKYHWPYELNIRNSIYHAAGHMALGMIDAHTIAVLEADTLAETLKLDLAFSQALPGNFSCVLTSIAWSPQGTMLAVCLNMTGPDAPGIGWLTQSEVQIFDAASGQHVQSLTLRGLGAVYSMWSSSLGKLVVRCRGEVSASASSFRSLSNTLRVLEPALQTVALVPNNMTLEQGSAWEDCWWDPSGALLVASVSLRFACSSHHSESLSGLCVLDPCTLRPIFRAAQRPAEISWGLLASSGKPPGTLVAYMPSACSQVTFWQDQSKWQVEERSLKDVANSRSGHVTPDGRTLLLTQMDDYKRTILCQHAFNSSETFAIAETSSPDVPFCNQGPASPFQQWPQAWPGELAAGHLNISWNPCLGSWSGVYAFQHAHPLQGGGQCLTLVDAKAHKVLGSWSGADLALLTGRRTSRKDGVPEDFHSISWSRNGTRIAAFCSSLDMVLILRF